MRVLSYNERETLKASPLFKTYCENAVIDYAAYWSTVPGVFPDEATQIKWAKNRLASVQIIEGGISDGDFVGKFIRNLKAIPINIPAGDQAADVIITAMANSNPDPNNPNHGVFDALADSYFVILGSAYHFTKGGN